MIDIHVNTEVLTTGLVIPSVTYSISSVTRLLHNDQPTRDGVSKLYDKRDDFSFPIVNFPFLCSNIPAAPAYGLYLSQLLRYSRACFSYHDFIYRGLLLTRKPLNQEFQTAKLKSSLSKFY